MNGKPGHPHGDPKVRADLMAAALMKFPRLQQHADQMTVVEGRPMIAGDDRQLESYPLGESWSPVPGKFTTELYNNSAPFDQQVNLVAGDMLHHLPMVDPQWDAMKRDVLPPELRDNPDLYRSVGDEFLMGAITPDAADHWRGRPGTNLKSAYTPEQDVKLKLMAKYLMGGGQ